MLSYWNLIEHVLWSWELNWKGMSIFVIALIQDPLKIRINQGFSNINYDSLRLIIVSCWLYRLRRSLSPLILSPPLIEWGYIVIPTGSLTPGGVLMGGHVCGYRRLRSIFTPTCFNCRLIWRIKFTAWHNFRGFKSSCLV